MQSAQGSRRLIGLMMGLIVLTPMGVDIFLPSLPVIARDFAVGSASMRWSITLYLVGMGLFQVLAGPLVDWLGRRRMAVAGALVYAIAAAICLLTVRLEILYAARLLQGAGAAMTTVVAFSCVRDRFEGERGAGVYSLLNAAVCVVPALAPLLGSLLATFFHWRATFVFMTLFAAGVALLCLWRLEETLPRAQRPARPRYGAADFAVVLADGNFLFYALIAMMGMAVILIHVTMAPLYLIDRSGLDEMRFGAWFGGVAAVNVVAYFVVPWLIKRLGRHVIILLGLGIMVAGGALHALAVLFHFDGVPAFMLTNALMATGFSLTLGAAMSLALAPHGAHAGVASSLIGCFQMAGGALLASLVTLLPVAPQWMLALVGVAGAGGLLIASLERGSPVDDPQGR